MTFPDFITKTTGAAVSYDGVKANTGQCVQLVSLYCTEVLDITPPQASAVDWWNNAHAQKSFEQIPLSNPIQAGDIVVFGASPIINSPEFGHIDICITPWNGGFTGFDSNWGGVKNSQGYPVAHEVQHSFQDVLGYLRFKGEDMYPNEGDVINAYAAVGEVAQPADIALYKSKTWSAPDGLYYGKSYVDLKNQVSQLKQLNTEVSQLKAPVNLAPGVYKV